MENTTHADGSRTTVDQKENEPTLGLLKMNMDRTESDHEGSDTNQRSITGHDQTRNRVDENTTNTPRIPTGHGQESNRTGNTRNIPRGFVPRIIENSTTSQGTPVTRNVGISHPTMTRDALKGPENRPFHIPETAPVCEFEEDYPTDTPRYHDNPKKHPASIEPGYYNNIHIRDVARIDPRVLDQNGVPIRDITRISAVHPDTVDASYIRNDVAKTRSVIDSKLRWDGMDSTFPLFKRKLESWMNMVGLYYMLEPRFFRAYTKGNGHGKDGWTAARLYAYNTTGVQFASNVRALYGAICTCLGTEVRGQRWITKYQSTSDGLMVWSKFLDDFNIRMATYNSSYSN